MQKLRKAFICFALPVFIVAVLASNSLAQSAHDLYLKGKESYTEKRYGDAIESLTEAIRLKQDLRNAYLYRALAYYYTGEIERAIGDDTTAIELDKDDHLPYYNRALVYYKAERFDEALSDLSRVIEINPNHLGAYLYRINISFANNLLKM